MRPDLECARFTAVPPYLSWYFEFPFVDNLRNLLLLGQSGGFGLGEILSSLLAYVKSSFVYTAAESPSIAAVRDALWD